MDLNERVKNLFCSMINCPEKIVNVTGNKIEFDNGVAIKYWNKKRDEEDVNNEPLKLESHSYFDYALWSVNIDIVDHLVFTIDTPHKQYHVPDFTDRMEYANVLNILDKDLAEFEKRKLSEYELHFISHSKVINDNF